jgi:hypothetical protein
MESPAFRNGIRNKKFTIFSIPIFTLIYFKASSFSVFNFFLSCFTFPIIRACFIILKIKIMDIKETRLSSKYISIMIHNLKISFQPGGVFRFFTFVLKCHDCLFIFISFFCFGYDNSINFY